MLTKRPSPAASDRATGKILARIFPLDDRNNAFPLCRLLAGTALLLLAGQEILSRSLGMVAPSHYLSPTFLAPAALAAFALFCILGTPAERRQVLAAGLAIEALRICLHLLSGRDPTNLLLFPGFGLGVATWGFLGYRALASTGLRRRRALDMLAGAVAIPFGHLLLWPCILSTIPLLPTLHDNMLIRLDASLGFQPAALAGMLFQHLPPIHILHLVIYFQIPLAMYVVAALEERGKQRMGAGLIPACLAAAVIGYGLYFLMPAIGPRPYFGDGFAQAMRQLAILPTEPVLNTANPRNAMPSLHVTWALLIYLAARRQGRMAYLGAAGFALGTALATLGLGEHYFIDLVVAVPLVLLVRALCAFDVPMARSERWGALALGVALLAGWCLVIRQVVDPTAWPGFAPLLMGWTVLVCCVAERALFQAEGGVREMRMWRLRAVAGTSD